jgi:hypothetical protein
MGANSHFQIRICIMIFAAMIILGVSSLILTQRIDVVVNNDLYYSGLQFSHNWADTYWANLHLLLGFLATGLSLVIISLISFLSYAKRGSAILKYLSLSILIASMCLNIGSVYFFNILDHIVNVDLYSYGLSFESTWAIHYWNYTIFLLLTIGTSIILAVVSSVLIIISARTTVNFSYAKIIPAILAALGFFTLSLSIVYELSILAFAGLGLIFWGILFIYIRTEKYVKGVLLDLTSTSQLTTLNYMLHQLEFQGGVFYLPPHYSNNGDLQKTFLPELRNSDLPLPSQTKSEQALWMETPSGLLLVPPGAELASAFEKILKKNFSNLKLQELQRNLSKLLIGELEIAKSLEVVIEPNKIQVNLKNCIIKAPNFEFDLNSGAYSKFGSSLGSALACIISKLTDKIVLIEKEQNNRNGEDLFIEYSLISSGV